MGVYFLDMDRTEKNKAREGSNEISDLQVVYKINKEKTEAEYYGLYECCLLDEEKNDYVVLPLESVYVKLDRFVVMTPFANVLKSSGDRPKGYAGQSWLKFYEETTGQVATECSVFPYQFNSLEDQGTPYQCNSSYCKVCKNAKNLFGGHVLAQEINPREANPKEYVWILPICNAHNNNNNGFMRLKKDMLAPRIWYRVDRSIFKQIYEEG